MTSRGDLLDIRFEHEPAIVTRQVAGEVILVPTRRIMGDEGALFTLDDVAAFLWERLDGKRSGRDLITALESAYSAEPGQAERDVRIFLEQLQSIEAIRQVSTPAKVSTPAHESRET